MVKKIKNIAALTGIAAGAGYLVGILTAPKSGRKTRSDIKKTASKAKTEGEKKLKKLHSELREAIDAVTKKKDKQSLKKFLTPKLTLKSS
jgi:gas vesicle protein